MRACVYAPLCRPHADALTQEAAQVYLQKQLKTNEDDLAIFTAFLGFNFAVLKTNFYRTGGVALSFRLSPTFLGAEYPDKPHGIFFVVGAEFRGFHTRFADVARGGIRLIKSASPQAYTNNLAGLFDECYSLASTQQRKNKDIPEGGSKGVILLNLGHQDKTHVAFSKYVDSIMDILLPNAEIVDHLGTCDHARACACAPARVRLRVCACACAPARVRLPTAVLLHPLHPRNPSLQARKKSCSLVRMKIRQT
ncbi:hypothetical protein EON67_08200 [archaeon]|nr:MAG: hypothetical protein EON67_08200 [archaeon]